MCVKGCSYCVLRIPLKNIDYLALPVVQTKKVKEVVLCWREMIKCETEKYRCNYKLLTSYFPCAFSVLKWKTFQ